jgi:hypothetical protein
MSDHSALATALAFARRGLAVFPVTWPVEENGKLVCSCMKHKRGPDDCGKDKAKHPYGKFAPHGLLSATTESGIIKSWWGLNAREANLGLCTDKLIVVDLDPRHGSDDSLAELDKAGLDWPHTWRSLTGGGGEHIIYLAPDGVEIASIVAEQMDNPPLGKGIDVRARGGYIVAPPSRHINGRSYCWSVDHHPAETPLAIAPDWLVEKLTARATGSNGGEPREPVPSGEWDRIITSTNYRDLAVARLGGYLFRHGFGIRATIVLVKDWNARHPPSLPDDEVVKILDRIAAKEAARVTAEINGGAQ